MAPTPGFDQAPARPPAPRAEVSPPPAPGFAGAPPPPFAPPAPPRQLGHAAALAFGGSLAEIRRPGAVTAIAVWDFIQGAVFLLMTAVVAVAGAGGGESGLGIQLVLGALYLILGAAHVAAGVGLLAMRNWARIAQIVMASIGLLGFPCGTLISVLILVYMLKPGIRILFSGRTGELTPEETAHVARALQSNAAMWAVIAVVGGLVVVAGIGIVAAIAIPSLLRARISANEAAALGHLREVVSAQATVESASAGAYASGECLRQPALCVPNWDASRSLVSETVVFDTPASGYVLRFLAGPPFVAEGESAPRSPHLLRSYSVTAVPASPQSGVRRFCADDSGIISIVPENAPPQPDARCPSSGRPLR